MINKDTKILIIGLGLIGGSYALRLSQQGYQVYGIDCNQQTMEFAKHHHYIIDEKLTDEIKIKQADLIIFGLYPSQIPQYISDHLHLFKADALLTDVAGIKIDLLNEINKVIDSKIHYVSHHPMTGREKSGIMYSHEINFNNANFIIIKDGDEDICDIKSLGEILGFKNIEIITAKEHDELIGYLSQLPHAIAIALMNGYEVSHLIRFSGDSFRDLTRIAKINDKLWTELFLNNKEILIEEIERFNAALNDIKISLENNDKDKLQELMKNATKQRERFDI